MCKGRDVGEELRIDVVAGDEQVDGLDTGRGRRVDEVLALGDEEPELLPLSPRLELANQLESRV
jgi:hypothetical protein